MSYAIIIIECEDMEIILCNNDKNIFCDVIFAQNIEKNNKLFYNYAHELGARMVKK